MWVSFFACMVIAVCMILNFHAYLDYKKYAKTALRVFDDTRIFHKVLRIFCLIGFVLSLAGFVYAFFFAKWDFRESFAVLALALLLALFAFVPYSSARWTLDEKGVYIYRARRFIPWTQVIQTTAQEKGGKRGKYSFLILVTKKEQGELFKRIYYSVILPRDQVNEVRQVIREFIQAIEKQKYYKNRQEEKSVELKDRKWF